VAWVGIVAAVGLALLGLWALSDVVRNRAARSSGTTKRPASRRGTTALLTVLAVCGLLLVVGAVLLVAIDLEGSGSGDGEAGSGPRATTTTVPEGPHLHLPQQVRIAIVNSSGFPRPATAVATTLRTAGFAITGTTSAPVREGTVIQCEDDFRIDAARLFLVLAGDAAIESLPDPPPLDMTGVDCVVVVGR